MAVSLWLDLVSLLENEPACKDFIGPYAADLLASWDYVRRIAPNHPIFVADVRRKLESNGAELGAPAILRLLRTVFLNSLRYHYDSTIGYRAKAFRGLEIIDEFVSSTPVLRQELAMSGKPFSRAFDAFREAPIAARAFELLLELRVPSAAGAASKSAAPPKGPTAQRVQPFVQPLASYFTPDALPPQHKAAIARGATCLADVSAKLYGGEYTSMAEFVEHVHRVFNEAGEIDPKRSLFNHAKALSSEFDDLCAKEASPMNTETTKHCHSALVTAGNATLDSDDKKEPLSRMFELSSKDLVCSIYPQSYARFVRNAIDLPTIHKKLDSDMYKDPEDLARDVRLMTNNCIKYHGRTPEAADYVLRARAFWDAFADDLRRRVNGLDVSCVGVAHYDDVGYVTASKSRKVTPYPKEFRGAPLTPPVVGQSKEVALPVSEAATPPQPSPSTAVAVIARQVPATAVQAAPQQPPAAAVKLKLRVAERTVAPPALATANDRTAPVVGHTLNGVDVGGIMLQTSMRVDDRSDALAPLPTGLASHDTVENSSITAEAARPVSQFKSLDAINLSRDRLLTDMVIRIMKRLLKHPYAQDVKKWYEDDDRVEELTQRYGEIVCDVDENDKYGLDDIVRDCNGREYATLGVLDNAVRRLLQLAMTIHSSPKWTGTIVVSGYPTDLAVWSRQRVLRAQRLAEFWSDLAAECLFVYPPGTRTALYLEREARAARRGALLAAVPLSSKSPLTSLIGKTIETVAKTTSGYFSKPAFELWQDLPESYFIAIDNKPMDLRTLKENLNTGKYANLAALLEDRDRIVTNARIWNANAPPNSAGAAVLAAADTLVDTWNRVWYDGSIDAVNALEVIRINGIQNDQGKAAREARETAARTELAAADVIAKAQRAAMTRQDALRDARAALEADCPGKLAPEVALLGVFGIAAPRVMPRFVASAAVRASSILHEYYRSEATDWAQTAVELQEENVASDVDAAICATATSLTDQFNRLSASAPPAANNIAQQVAGERVAGDRGSEEAEGAFGSHRKWGEWQNTREGGFGEHTNDDAVAASLSASDVAIAPRAVADTLFSQSNTVLLRESSSSCWTDTTGSELVATVVHVALRFPVELPARASGRRKLPRFYSPEIACD